MAQFDVYENPSKTSKKFFPYLIDIQNNYVEQIATRIVIPLGKHEFFKNEVLTHLTPEIKFEGEDLILLVPQVSSIDKKLLKKPIGTLMHFREEIISSLDFAVTGV